MDELRSAFLPAAVATCVMAYSCISGMKAVSKYRYAVKDKAGKSIFEHPYRPWVSKLDVPEKDAHYRAFKANENQREWFVYTLPFLFLFSAYGSGLPYIGKHVRGPGTLCAASRAAVDANERGTYTSSA